MTGTAEPTIKPRLWRFLALALLGSLSMACTAGGPTLADDMPEDLAAVVDSTLNNVGEAIPPHVECLDGLVVSHAWELEDRAEYRSADRRVVLRVPGTGPDLEFSLVHEIAHHLEFVCPSQMELRPAFLAAQGLPVDTAWFEGDSWEATPSEMFATAVAEYVTGRPEENRPIVITRATKSLVAEWALTGATTPVTAP